MSDEQKQVVEGRLAIFHYGSEQAFRVGSDGTVGEEFAGASVNDMLEAVEGKNVRLTVEVLDG